MGIRINKNTSQEINRVIKNFNAKIERSKRMNKNAILPSKVTKKQILEVTSRTELNRKLRQLRRFSKKDALKPIELGDNTFISNWEYQNTVYNLRSAKANLTKKINNLENTKPRVAGKKQEFSFAQMGDEYYLNLLAQRERISNVNVKSLSLESFQQLQKRTFKILSPKQNIFKESYLTMLSSTGYLAGVNNDVLETIIDRISKLKDSKFVKLFNEDKLIKSIIYYYIPTIQMESSQDYSSEINELYLEMYDNLDSILSDYE